MEAKWQLNDPIHHQNKELHEFQTEIEILPKLETRAFGFFNVLYWSSQGTSFSPQRSQAHHHSQGFKDNNILLDEKWIAKV